MDSFFSSIANCHVRWQDLPGSGAPMIFVHGLGCASSYEYPRVVTEPSF
ncbi:alpha/beta fold hydrolase, partial [Yersinia enterocolitica]